MSTLYEKRGRRYHPVAERDCLDSLSNGIWVVDIRDGRRFATRAVDPTPTLEALAAMPTLAELVAAELVEHSRREPSTRPTTSKERRAWEAYCAVLGDEATLSLTRPSAYDVASRVARKLVALTGNEPLLNSTKAGTGRETTDDR